jgi:hypothetical protein
MFNGPELLLLIVPWIVVLVALYWIIRLVVRDGITDAQRRRCAAETRSTPWN